MNLVRPVSTTLLVALMCSCWTTMAERSKRETDPNHPFPDSDWSIWTPCSAQCNVGYQARHNCGPNFQMPPLVGAPPFDVQLPPDCSMHVTGCNGFPCTDVFDWQSFGPCSAACGTGVRTRVSGSNCARSTCPTTQDIKCHTQSCSLLDGCGESDIVFVLDSSSSIGDYYFYIMKQLVIDVIKTFRTGNDVTRVGLITYSTSVTVNFDFNEYTTIGNIEDVIWGIPLMGDTSNPADGIRKARMLIEDEARSDVNKIMVVVTDGQANVQTDQTVPQADSARLEDIKMFAVGIGSTNDAQLYGIANNNSDVFVQHITNYEALPEITQLVTNSLCAPPCDGPVMYFSFDYDFKSKGCQQFVGQQTGTSNVGRSWDAKRWKSGHFDGTSRLTVPFPEKYFAKNYIEAFTVALWFKWKGDASSTRGLIHNGYCGNGPSFEINVGGTGEVVSASVVTDDGSVIPAGSFPVPLNQWLHVAEVYDGSTLKLYVGGTLKSSTAVNGGVPTTGCPLVIGQLGSDVTGFFHGYIDELRIYNRAVDASGIADLA